MTKNQYLKGTLVVLIFLVILLTFVYTPITYGITPKTVKTDVVQIFTGKTNNFNENIYSKNTKILIIPSSHRITDFSKNNNKITIEFTEDMDMNFSHITSRSISYFKGEIGINESWSDKRSFNIIFNKDTSFEFVKLNYQFKNYEGFLIPPVELVYE